MSYIALVFPFHIHLWDHLYIFHQTHILLWFLANIFLLGIFATQFGTFFLCDACFLWSPLSKHYSCFTLPSISIFFFLAFSSFTINKHKYKATFDLKKSQNVLTNDEISWREAVEMKVWDVHTKMYMLSTRCTSVLCDLPHVLLWYELELHCIWRMKILLPVFGRWVERFLDLSACLDSDVLLPQLFIFLQSLNTEGRCWSYVNSIYTHCKYSRICGICFAILIYALNLELMTKAVSDAILFPKLSPVWGFQIAKL